MEECEIPARNLDWEMFTNTKPAVIVNTSVLTSPLHSLSMANLFRVNGALFACQCRIVYYARKSKLSCSNEQAADKSP